MSTKPPTEVTWSIADVERETGLGKDTLRVWERRYGFPTPLRDALGERAYPQTQLTRLRLIKRLLDANHRPGKVVPLPIDKLQQLLEALGNAPPPASSGPAPHAMSKEEEQVWVQWLAQDQTALIRQSLQQQILRNGLAQVVDKVVAPLCGLVGLAWMRGEISVYQEHLFTETLQSVLREAISSVDATAAGQQLSPRVLLTTTPNELHGLGLLMAECHFALESCSRFVLGTSTPISDIVQAVQKLQIDVLALSFSPYATRKDVVGHLQQLREQLPLSVDIWVGGSGAHAQSRFVPEGLVLLRKAADVSVQLAHWRRQHGI
jgi:DNA-binding transcriptional MerR regulator